MGDNKKINIFLDLDNTLISAVPTEEMKWTKQNKDKAKNFDFHKLDNLYVIFERPNVQIFLDYLFENFNVSIWSAGTRDYVLYIIQKVLNKRKLDYVFFSYHCDIVKYITGDGPKDLTILSKTFGLNKFDMNNTIIIDDLKDVKNIQPCNCFQIKEFEFTDEGSENDNSLLELIDKLKEYKEKFDSGKSDQMCPIDNLT